MDDMTTAQEQSQKNYWGSFWKFLLSPSMKITNPELYRKARLQASFSLAMIFLVGIRIVIGFRSGSWATDQSFLINYILVGGLGIAYLLSKSKFVDLGTIILVIGLSLPIYGVVAYRNEAELAGNINTILWVLPGFYLGAFLLPSWGGVVWMLVNLVGMALAPLFLPTVGPGDFAGVTYTLLVLGVLFVVLDRYRVLLERDRQQELIRVNKELADAQTQLEQRVKERTQALETIIEVSRRLSTILDQGTLVKAVVDELQAAFGYYYVQIYLVDTEDNSLVLAGGTGAAGRLLLGRGHRLEKGRGIVGKAAAENLVVLVQDVTQEPAWVVNEFLPDTRAEIAVPIAIGQNVIGVLDLQSNKSSGFTDNDIVLLRSIANQVAVAVRNARVYSQAERKSARDALLVEIGEQIQQARSVEAVLQTAVRELGQVFKASETSVQLKLGSNSQKKTQA